MCVTTRSVYTAAGADRVCTNRLEALYQGLMIIKINTLNVGFPRPGTKTPVDCLRVDRIP